MNNSRYFRREIGPPPTERLVVLVLLFLVAVLFVLSRVRGDESSKPELWLHSDPVHCRPCRILETAIQTGRLNAFEIRRVTFPANVPMPCLVYRNNRGEWIYRFGWSAGHEKRFLEDWKSAATRD